MIGARTLHRFGLIGDVHGEDAALASVLRFLASLDVDAVLAVGDIVDGAGDVNRCCELLSGAGALVVRGNHERWLLEGKLRELSGATPWETLDPASRHFLANLPETREIATISGSLLLCHGLGADDMASLRPDDHGYALEQNTALRRIVDEGRHAYVVNGHTHRRMVRRIAGLTVVNAGTLHRDNDPCCALLDLEAEVAQFYDVRGTQVTAAEERRLAEWTELF